MLRRDAVPANGHDTEQAEVPPIPPTPVQAEEGVRAMQEAFQNSKIAPHWPMYLRNVKQFIKNSSPTFDERRYGFHSFLEAVRAAQRTGLFRLERNRQGILRVFPGNQISPLRPPTALTDESRASETPMVIEEQASVHEIEPTFAAPVEVAEMGTEQVIEEATEVQPSVEEKPARKRRASPGIKRKAVAPRTKGASTIAKRTRRKPATSTESDEDRGNV